jgi:ABC-2 type transport system permease protein
VLLWDTLFRGQLGVSTAFLEEMYARHLGHLFVSPLRPHEFVAAVFSISLLRVLIGVGGAAILAWPIHQFSLTDNLGWALIPFFAILLMFGWAIGIIIGGLVLRLGLGAENLAWAAIFFIQPLSGVYYPLDTLPAPMRAVGWAPALGAGIRGHAGGAGGGPLRRGPPRAGAGPARGLAPGRGRRLPPALQRRA